MKDILRKEYIDKRKNMNLIDKNQADISIYSILKNHPDIKCNNHIMVYVSTEDEVDTYQVMEYLLSEGKNLYVPVLIDNDIYVSKLNDINNIVPGKFNIGEPDKKTQNLVEPSVLEIVIVPGVCFTYKGVRLGRGGGYYDRFLKKIVANTSVIGVCYNFQILNEIPNDFNDVKVKEVITEKEEVKAKG